MPTDPVAPQLGQRPRAESDHEQTRATPPQTTANGALVAAATKPDSTAPSWFEAPMKSMFTAVTRPRSSSGVASCTTVARSTTLTWSATPAIM